MSPFTAPPSKRIKQDPMEEVVEEVVEETAEDNAYEDAYPEELDANNAETGVQDDDDPMNRI